MNTSNEKSDARTILGIFLLALAGLGLYWIVDAVIQLWNSPKDVPFVMLFIELLEENQKPIVMSSTGSEVNLPSSWPVVVGVFLCIVLISSIGSLVRSLLSNGLSLLFPESTSKKENTAGIVDRISRKND